jgi:hypothetical protein
MDRVYDDITQVYTQSGRYAVQDNCNSILFTNTGADTVEVNGKTLHPGTVGSILGDSLALGGNQNEIYGKKEITIVFLTTVNPIIEVTQKYYRR